MYSFLQSFDRSGINFILPSCICFFFLSNYQQRMVDLNELQSTTIFVNFLLKAAFLRFRFSNSTALHILHVSHHFRHLFSQYPAKWIFHHDSITKRAYVFHSIGILVCEFKLHLFTEAYCHTDNTYQRSVKCVKAPQAVALRKSVNEHSEVKLKKKFHAQVGSNEAMHGVGILSI